MNRRWNAVRAAALFVLAASWSCKAQAPASKATGPGAKAGKAVPGAVTAKKGTKGPRIACDQPDFDVGTVAQGDTMTHVFTLKNVGDDVLNILSARGG